MKISKRIGISIFVVLLLLFSLFSATQRVSDGLFSISNVEVVFEDSSYFLDLGISKEIDTEITFDVEIINSENIVISSRKFSCSGYSCFEKLRIGRTTFGDHEIIVSTRYERNKFTQRSSFVLEEIKNEIYSVSLPKRVEITRDSITAKVNGFLTSTKEGNFFFDIFPKSVPDQKTSFSLNCIDQCSFSFNVSQPLILGEYQVNVYSDFGESLYSFELGYFDDEGENTGSIEQDDSELESIIEKKEEVEKPIKKPRSVNTTSLFNSSFREQSIDTQREITKINLDGTEEKVLIEKDEEIILLENSTVIFLDEETNTRSQEKVFLPSLESQDLENQSQENTYINLNTKEVFVNSSLQNLTPGIYKKETIMGEDEFFAYGLVSINTQKPLYEVNSIAKFVIVVLDPNGYLVSSSNISLQLETPGGDFIQITTQDRGIVESKKNGVYFAYYNVTETGKYLIDVTTQVGDYELNRKSYVNVVDTIPFDIIRNVPATIDPFLGPFRNEFTLTNYDLNQISELRESIPSTFEITDTNADRVEQSEDKSRKYLIWDNISTHENFFYYSQTPLLTPYLYELGRAQISYGTQDYFLENRSWLFAIDPLVQGTQRSCTDTFGFDCSDWPATSEGDNTFDSCPSSTGGANDEHVDSVIVNSSLVYFGESVEATCTFDPYSAGTEEYIYYYNTTDWIQLYAGNAPDGNVHQVSATIPVSLVPGTHYVRCIIDWDGENDFCAETGQYYDNDDVSFEVLNPFLNITSPQNLAYSSPLITVAGTTDVSSTISYSINGGSFIEICSNCISFDEIIFLTIGSYDIEVRAVADSTLEENTWIESFSVTSDVINPPVDSTQRTCSDTFGFDCSLWPATSEGDNTFDSCPSAIGGAGDEHVDEVFINSTLVYGGDSVEVTCQFDPYGAGTEEYIYYYNTTDWTQLYSGNAPDANVHNVSVVHQVDSVVGTHYYRCIVDWDGENDQCGDGGSYYDNDDASIEVLELVEIPLTLSLLSPLNIEYTNPVISISGLTSKDADISYSINGGLDVEICSSCDTFLIDEVFRNGNYSLTLFAQDILTSEIINQTINFSVFYVDPSTLINTSGRTCSDTFGFDCSLWPATSEGDNTFDSCSSSLGNAGDENVQEVEINMSTMFWGTSVEATCFYDPYDAGTEVYMYYYNSTDWTQLFSGNAVDGNPNSVSQTFTVDDVTGTHYVRCIVDWDGENDFCANVGQYYDNDDVSFEVLEPVVIPYVVSLISPLENLTSIGNSILVDAFATKNSDFSYSLNGGSFVSLCSDCSDVTTTISIAPGTYNFTLRAEDRTSSQVELLSRQITLISPLNVSYETFDGTTTDLSLVSNISNVCNLVLENTSFGSIEFTQCIDADNADLDTYVTISDSFMSLDSQVLTNYNVSAILRYYFIDEVEPIVLVNGNSICTQCSILSYSGGILEVGVPHFSNYTVVENSSLSIYDYSDFFPVGINTEIGFFANYSFVNSSQVDDASCQIQFNTNGSYGSFSPMSYNTSIEQYDFYSTFSSAGSFLYNVSCSHATLPTINVQDTFVISPPSTITIDVVSPIANPSDFYLNEGLDVVFNVSCVGALDCSGVTIDLIYDGVESIGETGSFTTQNNQRVLIEFMKTYNSTPVVIATPATDTDSDNNALIPVIHNLNTTHVEFSLCEDAGVSTCSSVVEQEEVHYMVFDSDVISGLSWIDVGTLSNVPTDGSDTVFSFSKTFSNVPSVFAQAQDYSSVTDEIAPSGWIDGTITTSGATLI
ncbi:MAG: hypothetical protein VX028_03155, partial [Nanoarchaeota archaeon]|nr:hypothetical protein [Nanoarchaeota archaeon]